MPRWVNISIRKSQKKMPNTAQHIWIPCKPTCNKGKVISGHDVFEWLNSKHSNEKSQDKISRGEKYFRKLPIVSRLGATGITPPLEITACDGLNARTPQ
jgi:hypothetical protein